MAYTFGGYTANQSLTRSASPITAYPFSFSFWWYPTSNSGDWHAVISHHAYPNGAVFYGRSYSTASWYCAVWHGNNVELRATATQNLNAWNHATWSSASATSHRLRVNGTLVTSTTSATFWSNPALVVGEDPWNECFIGRACEVGVWNSVLSADQELALYAGYSPAMVRQEGLVAYYPLLDNARDHISGSSLTLSTAAPTVGAHHPNIHYPGFVQHGRWPVPAGGPTTYYVNMTPSCIVVPTLGTLATLSRTLSAQVPVAASLSRTATFFRALSAQVPVSAGLSRVAQFYRSLTSTVSGVPTIQNFKSFFVELPVTVTATPTLQAALGLIQRTLSATVSVAASLTKVALYRRSLSVGVTATASFGKLISKRLSAAVSGVATLSATTSQALSLSVTVVVQVMLRIRAAVAGAVSSAWQALKIGMGIGI